jgi:hypothetical protein
MQPRTMTSASLAALISLTLVACGQDKTALCSDTNVLATVKTLVDQRELGPGAELVPNMITPQVPSATYVATDQTTGAVRCSVVFVADLIEMMKLHTSDDDLAKIKVEAQKKGMPLSKKSVVNFMVNSLNSGQFYVRLID